MVKDLLSGDDYQLRSPLLRPVTVKLTFVGEIANNQVVVARSTSVEVKTEPASDNNLKAPLTQLRISQEGSEFWSVVTTNFGGKQALMNSV